MPSIFRMFKPLSPTAKGRALVKSEEFRINCVQRIDRATPQFIACYGDVEPFVRNIVVRALLPQREYGDQERIDFCQANIDEINAAMLPIVNMFLEYTRDPKEFARRMLKKLSIPHIEVKTPTTAASAPATLLDAPIPGAQPHYVGPSWQEGKDFSKA
jgi:hypothetical protein